MAICESSSDNIIFACMNSQVGGRAFRSRSIFVTEKFRNGKGQRGILSPWSENVLRLKIPPNLPKLSQLFLAVRRKTMNGPRRQKAHMESSNWWKSTKKVAIRASSASECGKKSTQKKNLSWLWIGKEITKKVAVGPSSSGWSYQSLWKKSQIVPTLYVENLRKRSQMASVCIETGNFSCKNWLCLYQPRLTTAVARLG